MTEVTADQVKNAALAAGISSIDHHRCSLCHSMVHFIIDGEQLYFDSECGCSSHPRPPEPRPWQDAASWINMQSSPEWRKTIAAKFGLTL